jgi:hypothetical protein
MIPGLSPDRDRVRAITGIELRKDALNLALDRALIQREASCDLLVRVALGNQLQHTDFKWCQRLLGDVLRDLKRNLRTIVYSVNPGFG